ncbi:MAG: hypothetical protein RLZ98_2138 [Pseudomonadota bacterium]|jgi:membrane protein involved in colicin uptake
MKRSTIAKVAAVLIPALAFTSSAEAGGRGLGIGLGLGIMTGMVLNQAAQARRAEMARERYMMREQMRRERARQRQQSRRQMAVERQRQAAAQRKALAARKAAAERQRSLQALRIKERQAEKIAASKHVPVPAAKPAPPGARIVTSSTVPNTQSGTKTPRDCARYMPQSGITVSVPCEN